MIVKFTKAQIKALKSIEPAARGLFDSLVSKYPSTFLEKERNQSVAFLCLSTLQDIIDTGEMWLDDSKR